MIKEPLDILNEVKPVEAPAFLLTRIYARIEAQVPVRFRPVVGWSISLGFCLVLLLNLSVLREQNTQRSGSGELKSFEFLTNSNDLYHE